MAIFNYEGETYFYANGKWLDSNSRPLPPETVAKLNKVYDSDKIKSVAEAQKNKQRERFARSFQERPNYSSLSSRTVSSRSVPNSPSAPSRPTAPVTTHKKASPQQKQADYELTTGQNKALSILNEGSNVFLSGEAGTGKSFVLNEYIFQNKAKNIIVCAPTGIAAINVGGSTLHRVFNIPINAIRPGEYNHKPSEALVKADIIIIDEISMCRFDLFEYIIRTIRRAEEIRQSQTAELSLSSGSLPELLNSKQIIVVGDFYQLPPVITQEHRKIFEAYWDTTAIGEGYAFQSPVWSELNFKNILLTEVIRQKGDQKYITHLNQIRTGNRSAIPWFNQNARKEPIEDSIYLCGKNATADAINQEKSAALQSKPLVYQAVVNGEVQSSDLLTQNELALKIGMQVMTLVNNSDEGYQNGSIGEVVGLTTGSVSVHLNTGKTVEVKPYTWEILNYEIQEDKLEKVVTGTFEQIPLKIAYAITIHKSQGQTYDSANIYPECFAPGQLYVALSRVSSLAGLCLNEDIEWRYLRTARAVRGFYEGIADN